jgi:putative glutamine amidotransferase
VARPRIGICAAIEQARWGPWDQLAVVLPRTYTDAVQRAGGAALVLPPGRVAEDAPGELIDSLDGLLVGGGADIDAASYGAGAHPEIGGTDPGRDGFEIELARAALHRDIPVLGVCRGMQVLAVAAGGSLEQHLPERLGDDRHRTVPGVFGDHEVRLEAGSLAARAAGAERLTVKSHHHQGVAEPGEGLRASGWADDDATIEAIESDDRGFVLGVLWHPEEDPGDRVIPALVAACR